MRQSNEPGDEEIARGLCEAVARRAIVIAGIAAAGALVFAPRVWAQGAPGGGGARGGAPAVTAPPLPSETTPKHAMVNLVLRDQTGADLQHLDADTATKAAGAQAQCAFVPTGAMAGTLAIAVGLKENFVLQLQIVDATKKATLQQVSLLLHDTNPSTLTSLTLEQNACAISDVKFDGKDVSLTLHCDNVGRELHAQRKLDAKIQVQGCPNLSPPVMAPPAR